MYEKERCKVIDLTPCLRRSRRAALYAPLALWTQHLSLAVLALYGLLRLAVCPGTPLGAYSGPLFLLWPVSYFLLLTSYITDMLAAERL